MSIGQKCAVFLSLCFYCGKKIFSDLPRLLCRLGTLFEKVAGNSCFAHCAFQEANKIQ